MGRAWPAAWPQAFSLRFKLLNVTSLLHIFSHPLVIDPITHLSFQKHSVMEIPNNTNAYAEGETHARN